MARSHLSYITPRKTPNKKLKTITTNNVIGFYYQAFKLLEPHTILMLCVRVEWVTIPLIHQVMSAS